MKIGVVGKGGVGKTTLSSMICASYAARGKRVIAVDTDSNPNLAISLGLSLEETEALEVLPRSLIVGSRGDLTVDEVIADYGVTTPLGPTVMAALRVAEAGAGCTCGGHATVRSLLAETMDAHADVTLIDMEAGIEHLSRSGGTLAHADILLMVMEATHKSVITAARTIALADELGIPRCIGVGNKARLPEDRVVFEELCAKYDVPLVAIVPYDPDVVAADRAGTALTPEVGGPAWDEIGRLLGQVDALVLSSATLKRSCLGPIHLDGSLPRAFQRHSF